MDNNSNSRPNKDPKGTSAEDLLKKLKSNIANTPVNVPIEAKKEDTEGTENKEDSDREQKQEDRRIKQKDINKIKEALKKAQTISAGKEIVESAPTKEIPKVEITPATNKPDGEIDVRAMLERFAPETLPGNEISTKTTSLDEILKKDDEEESDNSSGDRYERFTPKKKSTEIQNPDIAKRIKAAETYATNMTVDDEKSKDKDKHLEPVIDKKTEIDDVDVNLMIAFGMDDELAQTVGIEKVNEIESDLTKNFEHISEKTIQSGEIEREAFEFTDTSQVKEILQSYKKIYHNTLIRFGAFILLLILTFLYENISLFGGELPVPVNPNVYPIVYIMINLQFIVLASALIYKSLYNGMTALFKFKPIPESVTFTILLLTVIYHITLCILNPGTGVRLFNFPIVMCMFFTLIHEFMNLQRELYSFNIAASKRMKYTVAKINPNKTELENETFYEFLPQNPLMLKIKKASFVDGFYKQLSAYPSNKKIINVIIFITLIITALFFLFAYFFKPNNELYITIQNTYMALVTCTPFSILITFSYPFYKASKDAYENDSAILGEAALEEYSSACAISFDDKEVFPSFGVKMKSVKVYGNNRIDEVIYYTASLFGKLTGPLSDVFDIATMELGKTEKFELIEVADDGIEAMVGDMRILVGKSSYLLRNELTPINSEEDGKIEDGGEVSVMYMACGSEIAAKMYIQYVIDPDFEFIIRQLYKSGMCVGIKTFDPNINDSMLSARIRISKYPVKILRCRNLDDQIDTEERIESGIISKGSPKALLQTLAFCDKVLQIIKINLVVKIVVMMASIIAMAALLFLDMTGELNSFYITLYQLFWSVPMVIFTKLFI